jgi:hypothetical protein
LTPLHRESDTTVHRGRISKQGSRLVRWAAIEAVQRLRLHTGYSPRLCAFQAAVAQRRLVRSVGKCGHLQAERVWVDEPDLLPT